MNDTAGAAPATLTAPRVVAPVFAVRDAWRLALVAAELALVLLVVWRYQLESRTFFDVLALACAGFVVHALLPLRWRLGFFVALSLAAIGVAFGARDGAWLVGFGLVLIGVCHLRLRLAVRVGLLLATGALFAAFRAELLHGPWSNAIWPILGSMFMFRLALYLHALEHEEKAPTPTRTLAYFFMLPNVCFPLFPVVDYLSFRRNYYDRDAAQIYATGTKWIVRGLVQLIAYRFVYVHLAGDATRLASLGDLVQFLLATFFLYLRVSGQFHVICGLLYLFGFRLPETHHLYFLSSSFTDFWRRINIYWKDFMMKLVYYPSFFRLKRFGAERAVVGATLIVFAGTWLLHSYQWFWLRGGFPLEPQDGLFWSALGALVIVGALRELKRPRARKLGGAKAGWSFTLAWRTVATFCVLCLLWSLWSADSLLNWLLMWQAAGTTSWREVAAVVALLALGLAIAGRPWQNLDAGKAANVAPRLSWASFVPLAWLALLLALSAHAWYAAAAPHLSALVASVQRSTLNARDQALQQKGYYENLDNASRQSAQLWDVTARKPAHWVPLGAAGAYHVRNDFLRGELPPHVRVTFNDRPLTTNAWGMRDRERDAAKPPGVLRIAVLGPSHVMGSGVSDDETFTRLLEDEFARRGGLGGRRVEVLNFGVAAYALTQQLAQFEDKVARFAPDVVVFTDSPGLAEPLVQHVLQTVAFRQPSPFAELNRAIERSGANAVARPGVPVPFDVLRAALQVVGVSARMPWAEAEQRLRRNGDALLRATFDELTAAAHRAGAAPVFLALNVIAPPPEGEVPALRAAAAAGLQVIDLLDLWRGRDVAALRIAPWDNHPNLQGNRLIAERLAHELQTRSVDLQGQVANGAVGKNQERQQRPSR